ncbi:MAG TPA: universal stress protein [Solirubrobacteraceae bacterium]|nr:universal stress protein [Solirubrobacteraceae bacterium]
MILIAFDGSPDSRAAVEKAAELFPEQPATVLTVWEPFVEVVGRTAIGFGLVPSVPDALEIDEASQKAAERTAGEGVELASEHGMSAQPRVCSYVSTISRAILTEADRAGAEAIVLGSRGLTGLKSLLLGSVSHEVLQHADRTVIVVPSPQVAQSRAHEVREEAAR